MLDPERSGPGRDGRIGPRERSGVDVDFAPAARRFVHPRRWPAWRVSWRLPRWATGFLAAAWAGPLAGPVAAAPVPGRVVAWGYDHSHQTDVPAAAQSGVTMVAGGCNHSLALKSNGSVIAWGDDTFHQTEVPAAAQSGVVAVSAGCEHSLALKSNGQIVAWGDNTYGQLNVPSLPAGRKWIAIGAGERHSVGVANGGVANQVYAWGDDTYLQTEAPISIYKGQPVTLPNSIDVDAGEYDSIALNKNGTVAVWGGPPASLGASRQASPR